MKKLLLALCLGSAFCAEAQIATYVVISEVYGGGGNAGSVFRHDFIELYNPTSCPVSLSGWSVQYASATGSSWAVTGLSGTIPAKGFYLVREAIGAGGTANLPTPDDTGTIAMSGTAGKVALVSSTTALSGSCPGSTTYVDLIGYGTTAGCSEGSIPAPAPGNMTSAERKASAASTATTLGTGGTEQSAGNGYDANVNGTDFVVQGSINPQNSSTIEGSAGNSISVAPGAAPAEPASGGSFILSLSSAAPAGGISVTYSLSGTATAGGTDYSDPGSGSISIAGGATSDTIHLQIVDDLLPEGSETIVISLLTATGSYSLCSGTATLTIADNDVATTLIHTIQGAGSAAASGSYTAEGIVTGVYPLLSPAGFYMQEEDSNKDGNAATSEGIFVVSAAPVMVGDLVRVTGAVQESASAPSFDQAVFTGASSVTKISSGNALPAATVISLPVVSGSDYEAYEGMLVRFRDTLTVTNNFTLGRFGELGLSAGGMVYQPSQVLDPNDTPASGTTSGGSSNLAAIRQLTTVNSLRTILLDDGRNTIPTLPYADPADSTLRLGSTIDTLTGILGYAFGVYRVQPVPYALPRFRYAPRPALPSVGAAGIRVASFNVLNYFNGDGAGGGFPTARGAHSAAEFSRQRAKIISAITQINADVVGLIELENDGTGPASAIQDLVNGLNAMLGAGTYSIVNDGASIQTYGTDAIHCGIIYKPALVTATGPALLSPAPVFNRPPLAQTFTIRSNGELFNFIINHFKSKGCTGSTGPDTDQLDGQACFNLTRKQQAAELLNFIDTAVIPRSGSSRVLSVGDYNAYYEEDPLDMLRAAGYNVLSTADSYSYQFDGQIGSLDHAVASSALSPFVSGIAKWNINAAEPVYLDYNDAVNDGGGDFVNPFAGTYTPGPFRSSDHDPVIIGLNLGGAQGILRSGAGMLPLTVANPGRSGLFRLTGVLPASGQVHVVIYDLSGRALIRQCLSSVKGANQISLQTDLPPGTYMIHLDDGRLQAVSKATLL